MRIAYSFSVLRYVHDPVTQEFANVGVALYAPQAKYLSAICTPNYGRLSKIFDRIDGEHFRQVTRYLQARIEERGHRLESELPFELPTKQLGKPRESKLQGAYIKAQNILHKMPGKPELVQEEEAEEFAESLKREIEQHGE
jgi:hypothetical protein